MKVKKMTLYKQWHDQHLAERIATVRRMKRAFFAAFSLHIFTPLVVFLCLAAILIIHAH
jgi:hypothetical protein